MNTSDGDKVLAPSVDNAVRQTKNGWIDLSNLVYRGSEAIDWVKSIGRTVRFKYDDIESYLIITEKHSAQYVYIDIPNYTTHYAIKVGLLKDGRLGIPLKAIRHDFRYAVGAVINNLLITNRYTIKHYRYYDYRCLLDGYEGCIREDHLMTDHGCPVCANKVVLKGCNDISTTRPDMARLFLNHNDSYIYTECSRHFAYFKCPICGNIEYKRIVDVAKNGFSCKKCGDGVTYPNKFVYNVIEQLYEKYKGTDKAFNFYPEKTFDWSLSVAHSNPRLSGRKIYDMYIDNYNIIIENHGAQHFHETGFHRHKGSKTFEEEQLNDKLKMDTALVNGILKDKYIVLDCCQSSQEYIKRSIIQSDLPKLLFFNEEDIDWLLCERFASSSRLYEACKMWNDGIKDKYEIARQMRMHKGTISRYISRGMKLGLIVI